MSFRIGIADVGGDWEKGPWRAPGDSMTPWLGGKRYGNSLGNEKLSNDSLEPQ